LKSERKRDCQKASDLSRIKKTSSLGEGEGDRETRKKGEAKGGKTSYRMSLPGGERNSQGCERGGIP